MKKQQVWRKMYKSHTPLNHRCVKNKWVFKIKYGVHQAHLVAYGYSQVLDVDISENYLLVGSNITFCILLLMVIHFVFLDKIDDMETTFLYGDFEEGWMQLKITASF